MAARLARAGSDLRLAGSGVVWKTVPFGGVPFLSPEPSALGCHFLPEEEREGFQVVATQIKQKFSTLRFYYNGGDDYTSGLIQMAEAMSGTICESCGDKASVRTKCWMTNLCNACNIKQFFKEKEEREAELAKKKKELEEKQKEEKRIADEKEAELQKVISYFYIRNN
jgi:hypothetical protein